ncbi:5'-3' exoribonuclease 2, partial [Tieghemiomyces parasiticus]
MGIRGFYNWLRQNYGKTLVDLPDVALDEAGKPVFGDPSSPAPCGVSVDNLYVDTNGVVVNCFDLAKKNDNVGLCQAIFDQLDYIVAMARPRRLLYLALDGVVPRAKVNHQRSLRFQASHKMFALNPQNHGTGVNSRESTKVPGLLAPGTTLMVTIGEALRYYVAERLNSRPEWAGLEVIISDAAVPGEGENKIAGFIRQQQISPGYDSTTCHAICGSDADLILLALATHNPNLILLREVHNSFLSDVNPTGDTYDDVEEEDRLRPRVQSTQNQPQAKRQYPQYQRLAIAALREFLGGVLYHYPQQLPNFQTDRAIDDWIFLCCLLGNDFIPSLPALVVQRNAVSLLMKFWQEVYHRRQTYLTRANGEVDLVFLEEILAKIAKFEVAQIPRLFREDLDQYATKKYGKPLRLVWAHNPNLAFPGHPLPVGTKSEVEPAQADANRKPPLVPDVKIPATKPTVVAAVADEDGWLKCQLEPEPEEPGPFARLDETHRKELGREWYYRTRFREIKDGPTFFKALSRAYLNGLCWVYQSFYVDCPSWTWYYPYYYAPLAQDLRGMFKFTVTFDLGKPLPPLAQLMAALPPNTRSHLPPALANLMIDPQSPLIAYYPERFSMDQNGPVMNANGAVLLPFIDLARLDQVLTTVYPSLTEEERQRNTLGAPCLITGPASPQVGSLRKLYAKEPDPTKRRPLKPEGGGYLAGRISRDPAYTSGMTIDFPLPSSVGTPTPPPLLPSVVGDRSMRAIYHPLSSKAAAKAEARIGAQDQDAFRNPNTPQGLKAPTGLFGRGKRSQTGRGGVGIELGRG